MANDFSKELMHHGVKGMHWGIMGLKSKQSLKEEFEMNTLTTELMHHGVEGTHWYVRRYQPYQKGDDAAKKRNVYW